MNPAEVYAITPLGKGYLYMMPKPSAETLAEDIKHYRTLGLTRIVSVLREPEIVELKLMDEQNLCESMGLKFTHFPIQDMGVPELMALKELNRSLTKALQQGEHVAIHCHGGRGRAGTVAITLMQEFGLSSEQAVALAQKGRQDSNVPVCELQRTFVRNYLSDA